MWQGGSSVPQVVNGRSKSRSRSRSRSRFVRRWGFLALALAGYLIAASSVALVSIINPYALRPWGTPAKLAAHYYPDSVVPLLVNVAAANGTDLVVVGGSTSMGVSSAMLHKAFPSARHPINLSMNGPNARDYEVQLSAFRASPFLKRIIIVVDWPFIKDVGSFGRIWDQRPFKTTWSDPIPDYNFDAVRTSLHLLFSRTLDLPEYHLKHPSLLENQQPLTKKPEQLRDLAEMVDRARPTVASLPLFSCNQLPKVAAILVPAVRALAERGVQVDLLLPPYSLAAYSDTGRLFGQSFPGPGAIFANIVSLRSCVVKLTDGIPNVRVHAFDTELSITADLSRWKDTTHLIDYSAYDELVTGIAKGTHSLTVANWPEYESTLRRSVTEFTIH